MDEQTPVSETSTPVEINNKPDLVVLLKAAHGQLSAVLTKAEESYNMLQTNLQTVRDQRIALSAQLQMLTELLNKSGNAVK